QQRREFGVGVAVGQWVGVARGHRGVVGVAAVGVPAGVLRVWAQVLRPSGAVPAPPAGAAQPGDANPLPDLERTAAALARSDDLTDHLVAGDHAGPVHG